MNSDNLIGNILGGRYDIIEKIGTGGMASVYKAKDTLLNRYVAIKVLREALEGEKNIVKNFIKEAQSSASLTHNNIVSVFDVGEDDGVNYMVMELVDGRTLKDYIKEKGALPWQEACDYCIQIGQGLGEAHAKNIIHRDIKPQNIIMTKDKTLKVTDFGIARALSSDTTIVGGTALGSVHYISPEQARGGFTDARSDIYSLGIVLYEMLTGKVPFDGETAVSVALMHLEKDPVNVRILNMSIPQDLAYITMKAIAKEQAKRYQSVKEMLEDLHAVLADEPLVSKEIMDAEDKIVAPVTSTDESYESYDGDVDTDIDDFDEDIDDDFDDDDVKVHYIKRSRIKDDDYSDLDDDSEDDFDDDVKLSKKRKKKKNKKVKQQKTPQQKKADRLATLLALLTVFVMILTGILAYFILNNRGTISIPDVTGMTVAEATKTLEESGFEADSTIEYSISDDVETGRIIDQSPKKGDKIKKNESVSLIVSVGKANGDIEVPNLVNLTFDDAISKLSENKLNYNVVEGYSDNVQTGRIIRQTPLKGTKVKENDVVTLHVSRGRLMEEPTAAPESTRVAVPSLNGETKETAAAILQEQGLAIGTITMQYSESIENFIIDQSPQKGKLVDKGSLVNIIISRGPKPADEDGENYVALKNDSTDSSESDEGSDGNDSSTSNKKGKTQSFTVKIPDAAGDTVNVEIVANGQTVHNEMHKKSEGSVTVDIEDFENEGTVKVQAYIDGSKVLDKVLEF